MADEKKKYWLKLDKNFLKSPHIKVIKSMPNGKDYIIFYLALMLESVETVGHLKFSDLVPYNEDMLSALTDTNVDIVRSAVGVFKKLGLIEILDDGTIYMTQVAQMTGKESESADRVRKFREKKQMFLLQCNANVTKCNDNKEKEEEEEKEEDKDKDKYKEKIHFADFVAMTNDEYNKLVTTYSKDFADQCITVLDNYKGSSGKKYKNDYRAVLNWVVDKVKANIEKQNPKSSESMNNIRELYSEMEGKS